jgi:hypothetical protein
LTNCRKQQRHHDKVLVLAGDLEGVALNALGDKAELFIKRDRGRTILPHRQLNSRQAEIACRIERLLDQPPSNALPAKRRQQTYAEHPDMRMNRPRLRERIAPADDLASR